VFFCDWLFFLGINVCEVFVLRKWTEHTHNFSLVLCKRKITNRQPVTLKNIITIFFYKQKFLKTFFNSFQLNVSYFYPFKTLLQISEKNISKQKILNKKATVISSWMNLLFKFLAFYNDHVLTNNQAANFLGWCYIIIKFRPNTFLVTSDRLQVLNPIQT